MLLVGSMLFYNFNNNTKLVVYFNTEHKLYSLKNPYKSLCVAKTLRKVQWKSTFPIFNLELVLFWETMVRDITSNNKVANQIKLHSFELHSFGSYQNKIFDTRQWIPNFSICLDGNSTWNGFDGYHLKWWWEKLGFWQHY